MFKKVLIANRAEVASRIARTCKRLGAETVAVFSDADQGAVHCHACDEAVRIGPAPLAESYHNIAAILEAADATGADAIHPGYGLLSESPEFARAVREAGITFIGPSPEIMTKLLDRVETRAFAVCAGVRAVEGGDVSTARRRSEAGRGDRLPVVVKTAQRSVGIARSGCTSRRSSSRRSGRCASARARAPSASGCTSSRDRLRATRRGAGAGRRAGRRRRARRARVQRAAQRSAPDRETPAPAFIGTERGEAHPARRSASRLSHREEAG